jgi:hypothetical protein
MAPPFEPEARLAPELDGCAMLYNIGNRTKLFKPETYKIDNIVQTAI